MPETKIQIVSLVKAFEEKAILSKINNTLDQYPKLKEEFQLKTGKPQQVPNHILISFEVPFSKAFDIIKGLVTEGVPIISEVPIIKNAIREARHELQLRKIEAVQKMKNTKNSAGLEKKETTLEEIIETGDWVALLNIAKNKSVKNTENSKKIIEILPEILKKIIAYEIKREHDRLSLATLSLERLMKIATNTDLKVFRYIEIMNLAAEASINICLKYPKELISELITFMNNQHTSPSIKIKSFLTFYNTVEQDREGYDSDIAYASKNINTRLLNTAVQSVFNLNNTEKIEFRKALDFFSDLRRAGKMAG